LDHIGGKGIVTAEEAYAEALRRILEAEDCGTGLDFNRS